MITAAGGILTGILTIHQIREYRRRRMVAPRIDTQPTYSLVATNPGPKVQPATPSRALLSGRRWVLNVSVAAGVLVCGLCVSAIGYKINAASHLPTCLVGTWRVETRWLSTGPSERKLFTASMGAVMTLSGDGSGTFGDGSWTEYRYDIYIRRSNIAAHFQASVDSGELTITDYEETGTAEYFTSGQLESGPHPLLGFQSAAGDFNTHSHDYHDYSCTEKFHNIPPSNSDAMTLRRVDATFPTHAVLTTAALSSSLPPPARVPPLR
jgi:hypothetical protein